MAPLALSAAGGKIPVGLELYSVRNEMGKDLPATVTAVAKMGYQVVEFFAPYYDWTCLLYTSAGGHVQRHVEDSESDGHADGEQIDSDEPGGGAVLVHLACRRDLFTPISLV